MKSIPRASGGIITVSATNTADRQPDLVIEFSKGDYSHAIRCYERARQWVMETGQAYREDLYGRILRPEHPQSPQEDRTVPLELADDPNWVIRVQLFAYTKDVLDWLLELPLPEDATLVRAATEAAES